MNAGRTNDGPPCDSLFFALSLVMFLFTTVVLYAIALQLVHALPVVKRIVISPPITSPNAGTVWTPGKSQLVTWDTSVVPPNGTFPGVLVLGYQTPGSENLNVAQPLASGFSLRDGSVYVTCPTVTPGNNYIVVLFGDSGNASPQFTISGPSTDDDSAASQVTQPSSTELTPSPPVSTTSSTSSVPEPSSGSLAPALTTSPAVPQDDSSPTGYTSLSASPSQESTSSSTSTVNPTPLAGLNTNVAISRIQKPGAMVACAIFSVFMTFLL